MKQISLGGLSRLFSGWRIFSRQKRHGVQMPAQDLLPVSEPGVFVPGHRQPANGPEDRKSPNGEVEPISEPGVVVVGRQKRGT